MSRLRPTSRRIAVAVAAAAALALFAAATPAQPVRWSAKVETSPIGAYIVGNPNAKVRLVEYFSYTCSHCAEFAKAGTVPLRTLYIDKGLVLFEYRNLVRDPVDMTAALLARCGAPAAFAGNHDAIFAAQPVWLGKVAKATEAQRKSWYQGSLGDRARRIAADTGLTAIMQKRGYTMAQIGACLDSEVAQAEIAGMTNIGQNADRVAGTPTFFINGRNAAVVQWAALKTKLDAALKGS
jgi:protein-disulfide isomerase